MKTNPDASVELSGIHYAGVPSEYKRHPMVDGKVFFTIPDDLLDRIVRVVGAKSFDPEAIKIERCLSKICRDHTWQIGFWRGHPINYSLLRPIPFGLAEGNKAAQANSTSRSRGEVESTLMKTNHRVQWARTVQRGYCGWLMTNRRFFDEQLQLIRHWETEISENGIPAFRSQVKPELQSNDLLEPDSELSLAQDFDRFFIRWRLIGMSAPGVPNPLGPQLPVVHIGTVLPHLQIGGGVFYIPDIFPIPTRDDLREILEEELRFDDLPDHISPWGEIVSSVNKAKNRIERFGRLFEMQHYMRALHTRHSRALYRKKSAVILAMAAFFGISEDSIESDLREIADRLGKDWLAVNT